MPSSIFSADPLRRSTRACIPQPQAGRRSYRDPQGSRLYSLVMVVQAVRRTRRPRRGSTPVLNCAEAVAPLLRTGADPNARVGASDGGPAAVDEEHMPGHVARGIGGKEEQPAVDLMQRGVRARSVCSPTDGAKPSSARKPVIVSIL